MMVRERQRQDTKPVDTSDDATAAALTALTAAVANLEQQLATQLGLLATQLERERRTVAAALSANVEVIAGLRASMERQIETVARMYAVAPARIPVRERPAGASVDPA
jgi:hypothetical protein